MSTKEFALKVRRLTKSKSTFYTTTSSFVSALFGVLLSNTVFAGQFAPLGIAVVGISGKRGIFAFLGAVLGYVAAFTPNSVLYCGALLMSLGLRLVLSLKSRRFADKAIPAAAVLSLVLCSLPKLFTEEFSVYLLLASVCEAFLLLSVTWLVARTDALLSIGTKPRFTESETASLCVTASVFLCGFSSLLTTDFNLIRAFIFSAVLFSSLYGGILCGVCAGTSCGVLLALLTQHGFFIIPLALGGMAGGVIRRHGKAAAVTAMLVACAMALALCEINDTLLIYVLELLIGCGVLLILPDSLLQRLGTAVFTPPADVACDRRAATRLYNAGKGLHESAECITAVSDRLKSVNAQNPAWVYESASSAVCSRCGLKNTCWNENYSETLNALQSVTTVLTRFGRVNKEDLPAGFSSDCPKSAEMAASINRFYNEYAMKKSTDDYAFQMRGMLANQFKGLADIVMELSEDLADANGVDRAASRRAYDVFADEYIRTDSCVCVLDRRKRMTLEITGKDELMSVDSEIILPRLEEALGRRFRKPVFQPLGGGNIKLVFSEKTEYKLETAVVNLPANGEKTSGDRKCIFTHNGDSICIISDGMGSGSLASVESKMTVTLLRRLICAGFNFESALSVVNWSLMVKGSEERLATVDLLSVDLYNGNARLLKAGAAPTFIKHKNDTRELSFPSMPVGILTKTEHDSRSFKLLDGDIAVMVSDGVLYEDSGWIIRELNAFKGDIAVLADSLAQRAKARRPSNEDDDITVLCARLVKT